MLGIACIGLLALPPLTSPGWLAVQGAFAAVAGVAAVAGAGIAADDVGADGEERP